jgi:hypothetical protein
MGTCLIQTQPDFNLDTRYRNALNPNAIRRTVLRLQNNFIQIHSRCECLAITLVSNDRSCFHVCLFPGMLACVARRVRRTVLLVTLMVASLAQRPQVNCLPSTRVCLVAGRGSPPQHQPHLRSEVSVLMYLRGNLGLIWHGFIMIVNM